MKVVDVNKLKLEMLKKLKHSIDLENDKLGLAMIQIGNDTKSNIFVRENKKLCTMLGIKFEHISLGESASLKYILYKINELNNTKDIDGILVGNYIPDHFDKDIIYNSINPIKDIDNKNIINKENRLNSIYILSILKLLEYLKINFNNKNIVILSKDKYLIKFLTTYLGNRNGNIIVSNIDNKCIKDITSMADILILNNYKENIINKDYIKDNSIVIDTSLNINDNGLICGDLDYNSVINKDILVSTMPNGIGQLIPCQVMEKVVDVHKLRKL